MSRRICVFTGTRAEYGLLRPVIRELGQRRADVTLLVSGSHLSDNYGQTLKEIEADALAPVLKADMGLADNSPSGICAAMGRAISLYGRILGEERPELLLVLGDRYEAFCAVAAAVVQRVPVAHLYGGETTLGAIDEYFRHAMTTMSQLHFTACEKYRQNVISLGANPEMVWNVGALGVENALNVRALPVEDVRHYLGIPTGEDWLVATWHPETLGRSDPIEQITTVAGALDGLAPLHVVFTGANADSGGQAVNDWLQEWCAQSPRRHFFMSLGVERYLNAARYARAVVGNSSSGVIEIPSLHVPVLDIGDRQKGRMRSRAVLHCECTREDMAAGMERLLSQQTLAAAQREPNPFEMQATAEKIAKTVMRHITERPNDAAK